MTTRRPVSEADAKAEKKDEHKETEQNLACRRQQHFRQEAAITPLYKKKKETKKNISRVLIARQSEWQRLGTRAMCM